MNKHGKVKLAFFLLVVVALSLSILMATEVIGKKGGIPGGGGGGAPACNNGLDDDGDGLTDLADPGCNKKNDRSELGSNECDDGIDNDGDGDIDTTDVGCADAFGTDETNCGDNICEGGETQATCSADCGFADSCSDTDGGFNPFSQGITSGLNNNVPYSNTDACANTDDVVENYCIGTQPASQLTSCGTDESNTFCQSGNVWTNSTDFFCSAGACTFSGGTTETEICSFGCTAGACDPAPQFPDLIASIVGSTVYEAVNSTPNLTVISVDLDVEITNIGDATSGSNFAFVGNPAYSSIGVPSLVPSGVYVFTSTYQCTADHIITVTADFFGHVAESDETNNADSTAIICAI